MLSVNGMSVVWRMSVCCLPKCKVHSKLMCFVSSIRYHQMHAYTHTQTQTHIFMARRFLLNDTSTSTTIFQRANMQCITFCMTHKIFMNVCVSLNVSFGDDGCLSLVVLGVRFFCVDVKSHLRGTGTCEKYRETIPLP